MPHVTLKSIANNAEIDIIWEKFQQTLEPLREQFNEELQQGWEEWQIPREAQETWSKGAQDLHGQWWDARPKRQVQVKINGVDVFHPNTGEVRTDGPDGIACWFIDTDTTKKASSCDTPTSSARMIPTSHSRPPSKLKSTRTPGHP